MNIENIQSAINMFSKLDDKRVDMSAWYSNVCDIENLKSTNKAKTCGTVACFAGWVGTLKEFKAAGGIIEDRGRFSYWFIPLMPGGSTPAYAMSKFFGITRKNANYLCGMTARGDMFGDNSKNPIYGVKNEEVTPKIIIKALQNLLTGASTNG